MEDLIQRLHTVASERLEHEELERDFQLLLAQAKSVQGLRQLAEEYTPHPEISVPLYLRLLELTPDDADSVAELGFVFWLSGEDEKAKEQAIRALRIAPANVKALLLQAALEPDLHAKGVLYRQVLECDPRNQVALANLRELTLKS